jgi:hypothetical protein
MRADKYRHYAVECLEVSEKMHDPGGKVIMRFIAIAWANLADQVENRQLAQRELHESEE